MTRDRIRREQIMNLAKDTLKQTKQKGKVITQWWPQGLWFDSASVLPQLEILEEGASLSSS